MFPLALLNASAPAVDPASLTLALLHFDGADGSTTFTDSSQYANTFTLGFSGNPIISTLQSKFGGSSLKTNGSVFENVICQKNDGFWNLGNSDFTTECWFYQNATSGSVRGLFFCQGDSATKSFAAYIENGILKGQIQLQTSVLQTLTHQTTVTAAGWHHMALVRNNGIITLYLDGIASTSTLSVGTDNLKTGVVFLYVGGSPNGLGNLDYSLNGYQDEFRLRKEAVYTADFTPPTSAFTY